MSNYEPWVYRRYVRLAAAIYLEYQRDLLSTQKRLKKAEQTLRETPLSDKAKISRNKRAMNWEKNNLQWLEGWEQTQMGQLVLEMLTPISENKSFYLGEKLR